MEIHTKFNIGDKVYEEGDSQKTLTVVAVGVLQEDYDDLREEKLHHSIVYLVENEQKERDYVDEFVLAKEFDPENIHYRPKVVRVEDNKFTVAAKRLREILLSLEEGFGEGHRYLHNPVTFTVCPPDKTNGGVYSVTVEKLPVRKSVLN